MKHKRINHDDDLEPGTLVQVIEDYDGENIVKKSGVVVSLEHRTFNKLSGIAYDAKYKIMTADGVKEYFWIDLSTLDEEEDV